MYTMLTRHFFLFMHAEDVETTVTNMLTIEPEQVCFLTGKLLGGMDVPVYSWWGASSTLIAWSVDLRCVEDMQGLAYCDTVMCQTPVIGVIGQLIV
jgi:hypothetical protein